MATDTSCKAGHRRRIAIHRPRDLTMRTPRHQAGGHRQQQLGTFHVVGTGEGPQREAASAGGTNETGNTSLRVSFPAVGPVSVAAVSLLRVVVRALAPGAMRRSKTVDSPAFYRLARNAHIGGGRARAIPMRAAAVYGTLRDQHIEVASCGRFVRTDLAAGGQQPAHHAGITQGRGRRFR